MTMILPEFIKEIMHRLSLAGLEAYLVGGCVRDSLLGRTPDDWDITTNGRPEQIMALFPHCIPTGLIHGTVTVILDHDAAAEITTYRTDGIYEDGRHPKQVVFSGALEEDLARRDFTMNAIAYSPAAGFVDLFQGLQHIRQKRICCVGDPLLRFSEDALRMMRAIRFSAVLGFSIEPSILDAICSLHENIGKVSIERIQAEFSKMLLSGHPQRLDLLLSTGLLPHFLPEITAIPYLGQFQALPHTLPCRLAVFLGELPPAQAKEVLKRLRYSNTVIQQTCSILKNAEAGLPRTETAIRQRLADKQLGQGFADYLVTCQALGIPLQDICQMHRTILQRGDCTSLASLAINGHILEQLGFSDGKTKGTVLRALLQTVLEHPEYNTKEQLIAIALKIR